MHSRLLLRILHGVLLVLAISTNHSEANESPGFFLKITKNIPRLGRRSDNYFLKNMKAVPRMGRSADESTRISDIPSLAKRMLMSPSAAAAAAERQYSLVQPVTSNTLIELLNTNAVATDNIKFIHWRDFDRALQMDTELYDKLISLGRKPDQRLKEDLNIDMSPEYTSSHNNNNDNMYYNKNIDDMYSPSLYYNQLK
ncbi:uncharacterized protein ETH [Eurosta solidaginis]|uniref:uncharacterized protein ETH n=1 Tax=Eurosta solidaginis TaxID=178769 RepID=UPI0035315DBA